MSLCDFCSKPIPQTRIQSIQQTGGRVKYCSDTCNKHSWINRNRPGSTSFYKPSDRAEWLKTETGKGYLWEQFVANLTGGVWQGFGAPFDVLDDDKRLDVKVANIYKRKRKRGKAVDPSAQSGTWVFNRNSSEVDEFFCIGLKDGVPIKMFRIPASEFGKGISVGVIQSKYDQYLTKT